MGVSRSGRSTGLLALLTNVEPVGVPRLKESLETNEWDSGDLQDIDALDFVPEKEDFLETFAAEEAEMGVEILGVKTAVNAPSDPLLFKADGEEALQVEELELMMRKMRAVKGKTC